MIEVENLSKSYGTFEAIKNISFSAGRGQVLGLLGPNGAGKTTVMKILAGCVYPSGGTVKIGGFSVEDAPHETKRRIGWLPENNPLYGEMNAEEYLNFAAAARLIRGEEKRKAVNSVLAACGLEAERGRRIESLSKGYRQRIGLAQAIVHDPEILILDEPTTGLDPGQIIEIRNLVRELGKKKTVILSSHILREVEAVCSGVLILNEGRVAARGTPEEIARSMTSADREIWELFVRGGKAPDVEKSLAAFSGKIAEIRTESLENGIVKLTFFLENTPGAENSGGDFFFDWAVSQNYKLTGMSRKEPGLEDVFAFAAGGKSDG